jgi:hypothetical protein
MDGSESRSFVTTAREQGQHRGAFDLLVPKVGGIQSPRVLSKFHDEGPLGLPGILGPPGPSVYSACPFLHWDRLPGIVILHQAATHLFHGSNCGLHGGRWQKASGSVLKLARALGGDDDEPVGAQFRIVRDRIMGVVSYSFGQFLHLCRVIGLAAVAEANDRPRWVIFQVLPFGPRFRSTRPSPLSPPCTPTYKP